MLDSTQSACMGCPFNEQWQVCMLGAKDRILMEAVGGLNRL